MYQALVEVKRHSMELLNIYHGYTEFTELKCVCCPESMIEKLVIHHLSYHDDSVVYSQFTNTTTGRIQYYAMICTEIVKHHGSLRMMCMDCHTTMEDYVRQVRRGELNSMQDAEDEIPSHILGMFYLTLERQKIISTEMTEAMWNRKFANDEEHL